VNEVTRLVRLEATREAWRGGYAAEVQLDTAGPTGGQQEWLRRLDAAPRGSWTAWEVSRQRGKTFAALTWVFQRLGLEQLSAVYLAQTGANAAAIVAEYVKEVGDTLPPEWGVRFVDGEVRFANGSELAVFGTDNGQYRRNRGRKAGIILLDEAGFYADLIDVEQVYQPQLQTTGGVGLYLSSPALNPAHEFSRRCDALRAAGRYVRDTFWSNPRIDHEAVIRGEMERLGLTRDEVLASTAFRREYLAERVTEETRAALPAWDEAAQRFLVGDWARPQYFDAYVGLDVGKTGDPHAAQFGFHDPATNTFTVEDELEMPSATTHMGAFFARVKEIEARLWGVTRWEGTLYGVNREDMGTVPEFLLRMLDSNAPRQPYLRVGDDDARLTVDAVVEHGIAVVASAKHDKALWVDSLNQRIRERRWRVHRRCVRTLEQYTSTLWDKPRSKWERTAKDHGDLVDDSVYLQRNVRWHRDCRPKVDNGWPVAQQQPAKGWADAFQRRKR
jgi:hypothetical protein